MMGTGSKAVTRGGGSSGAPSLTIEAPAKINLFLAVVGRRPDGYHDIISAMQKIDLFDRLHMSCDSEGIELLCPQSTVPENSTNLAWKAAKLFFDRTGVAANIRITLDKNIPVAAGLGGGSSDAAAALVGLNRLYETGLSNEELREMAASLGADVPFFVADSPSSLATGTGIELNPFHGPNGYWLVLVNPGISVSTRWVYQNLILTKTDAFYKFSGSLASIDNTLSLLTEALCVSPPTQRLFNDLEAVTISHYPKIGRIKEALLESGARASLMSGSGSSVFGIFDDYGLARQSVETFGQQYTEVFLTSPLQ